jgi:hypothetical protein
MSSGRKIEPGQIVLIGIAGVILYYFGSDILAWVLELIYGIGNVIKTLVTELIYFGLFIGVIFLLIKVYEFLRGK